MLKRIILASSNKGDLVMDCFAGSGTTLAAADELERNWIGVDAGSESIRIILNRFQNGTETLDNYHKNDTADAADEKFPLFSSQDDAEPIAKQPSNTYSQVNEFTFYANSDLIELEFQFPLTPAKSLEIVSTSW